MLYLRYGRHAAASAAQPKPSAPEGRGAVPDGVGTALHGGGSGRRPLRDPAGRFSGRSLRRSDTHGLHNVSTAHRQRLHRHRPAAARHGAARAATPTGLRPRRHEPPPRSGVGTHPTAPSPARRGGRRAGDGRRRPDGADTRAACALRPHGNGTRAGRIGASRGDGFPLRQSAAGSPRAAAPRPSPAQCGGHRRHLALRRGGGAVARHDPRRRDVHGPATGAGHDVALRRRQHPLRGGLRDAAVAAVLPLPRRVPAVVPLRGGDPPMGYPALPAAAHAVAGGERRGGNARRRRGRLDGDGAARILLLRADPARRTGGQSARHPAHLRGGRGIAAVAGDPLAAPFGRHPSAARRAAVAAKPAGRRSGRPALCRDRLPDDGGADRRGLSLFRNFHPRGIPSVAEKSVPLPA